MKTLIEITRLVNAFKESHQRAEEKITNSNRFKEIYEGILMGKYQTDEEVITDLYNTPSGKKSYQKQKERYRHGITAQLLGYGIIYQGISRIIIAMQDTNVSAHSLLPTFLL